MRLTCPHCGAKARIRTSREMSDISRESKVQCTNPDCSFSGVQIVSWARTIAPSMTPNPKVFIPISPRSPAYTAPDTRQLGLALDCAPPR